MTPSEDMGMKYLREDERMQELENTKVESVEKNEVSKSKIDIECQRTVHSKKGGISREKEGMGE